MSCPVWDELVSFGEALLREGSDERTRAEEHLRVCSSCAERAFLLDPSWAVRKLPTARFESAEIEALERSLAQVGRIGALERAVSPWRWARTAAVAVLVALAAVAGFVVSGPNAGLSSGSSASEPPPDSGTRAQTASVADDANDRLRVALPAIGSLAPAAARVYELGEEDFALVMVVHETLDL